MRLSHLATLALALPASAQSITPEPADVRAFRALLLEGVESIHKPGVPASICTVGENTFPIFLGRKGESFLPVAAGALHGNGAVVLFGHGGYLSKASFDQQQHQTGRLLLNVLGWLAGQDRDEPPRVAVLGNPGLVDALVARRVRAESVRWNQALSGDYGVIVHGGNDWGGRERVDEVLGFVESGGGFLGAGLRWGWEQLNPGRDPFSDFDANAFALRVGLAFGIGTLGEIGPRIDRDDLLAIDTHALEAAARLFGDDGASGGNEARGKQWGETIVTAVRSLPPEGPTDRAIPAPARAFLSAVLTHAMDGRLLPPTPDRPLTTNDPRQRIAWTIADFVERAKPPEATRALPGSEEFPGAPRDGAEPTDLTERVVMDRPGWTGTGIWIPAGQAVRLRLEPRPVAGLYAQIGCHTDRLWHKDAWSRHPDISVRVPLSSEVTTIATPYGGLLFLGHKQDLDQEFELRVEGAFRSPRFLRGVDDPDWNDATRAPGPWAELVGEHFAMCVPSEHVRDLENAEELMTFWDQAITWYEELDRRPVYERKERFVTDVQISAGYMHSGYPIMTHLDVAPVMVDLEKSRSGSHGGVWGFWHELGHNRQLPTWTFSGTGEVTNNLFSLFVIERHQGLAPSQQPQIRNNKRRVLNYLKDPDFAVWKRQPFTALAMYVELQEEFGWEAFQNVFADYLESGENALPKSDAEKRDQWMVRFSREVERDLSPFFHRWGVPVSGTAVESLRDFEPWDGR